MHIKPSPTWAKCVGFGDGVSIENCNEDVKPFHDILLKENIVFLEVP